MNRKSWPWRGTDSERSPGESESSGSVSSYSGRYSDDQDMSRSLPDCGQSPEISSNKDISDIFINDAYSPEVSSNLNVSRSSPIRAQSPEVSSNLENSGSCGTQSHDASSNQDTLRSTPNNVYSPDFSLSVEMPNSAPNHLPLPKVLSKDANSAPNHLPLPKVLSKDAIFQEVNSGKSLAEKLSAALANIRAKDDMVKQHAKVAEEAVLGWEKAENEVSNLKVQLESEALKNLVLEDKIEHLDGALKECVRQLRQAREEQEEKVHSTLVSKTHDWKFEKIKLEGRVAELESLLEFAQAETSALVSQDFELKLEVLLKENSDLKLNLCVLSEQLKIQTLEKELSIQAAETASKQLLESIKKLTKLESECRRLRAITRKTQNCNDHKSLGQSTYVDSLTDSQSDSGERMLALENEPSCSDSWASALIAELDQFKGEKIVDKNNNASSSGMDIMDDFLEMERLAALPELQITSPSIDVGAGSDQVAESSPSKGELEHTLQRISLLEETIEKMETEKAQLEIMLANCQDKLVMSCNQLEEAEIKLEELQNQLDHVNTSRQQLEMKVKAADIEVKAMESQLEIANSEVQQLLNKVSILCHQLGDSEFKLIELQGKLDSADFSKQEFEIQAKAMEADRKVLQAQLDDAHSEVQKLLDNLQLLERKLEKERISSEGLALKCEELEAELLRRKQEEELRRAACSNGELKLKQERELAVAAGRLAECQQTIASLGLQLKSLACAEDFMEVEKLEISVSPVTRNGIPRRSLPSDSQEVSSVSSILSSGKERWRPSFFRIS